MNKYQAAAVKKGGSKEKQNNGCRTTAIFTNEQAQKKLSSGISNTSILDSKKDFTKAKIPKTKIETKGKLSKLQKEQKIFKLEDDKKAVEVNEKFCNNKSKNNSAIMRSIKIPIQVVQ
jgi:hypothetical protein